MKRIECIVAAALLLELLPTDITGYFIRHSGQDKYVRAEMVGASEGVGIAGVGESVPKETGGASGVTNPDSARGTSGPDAADSDLSDALGGVKEQDPKTGTENKDPPLQFVFASDILLLDRVLDAYQKAGNIGGVVDSGSHQTIDASDIFVASKELPFSRRGTAAADKQFTLRLPPEKVFMFQELGIGIVIPASNHALDFGTDALLDTYSTPDDARILRVGVGTNLEGAKKPVFVEARGRKVGFLGTSRIIPENSRNTASKGPGMLTTYDPSLLLEKIKKAREACDHLVIYVYQGIERDERPQKYQRILGQRYIDTEADLVVGSYPYVMQGLEYYRRKPIIYNLGNFVFSSNISKMAPLKVEWDREDTLFRLVPGTSSGGYTRMLTNEGEKTGFYRYITSISRGVTVGEDEIVAPGEENTAEQEESGI